MHFRIKYVWYCALGIFAALAFFNIFSWPHDSRAAMELLVSVDNAVFRPAAHPTMFALVVGVAIGTVLIPEIWRVVREHAFPVKPFPNMDMLKTVEYLRVRSQWAIGRVYYKKEPDRLLEEDIDTLIRDAAAQGRITIWGRPRGTSISDVFYPPAEIEIPHTDWTEVSFDLTTMADAPHGVCARDHRISEDRYTNLRVNDREAYREWPRAFYGRLLLDKTWKSRRKQMVDET
jgi:hypothetical protein